MKENRKDLSPGAKERLKKATKEAVQKHWASWSEEKQIEVQEKDLEYRHRKGKISQSN